MSFFKNLTEKITKRPSREETILETGLTLDKLKKKYEKYLAVQRRIVNGDPTPREKEVAEAKIRSAMCAYTICTEASRRLDEISSDDQLTRTLSDLNGALRTVNRLGGGSLKTLGSGISRKAVKMKEQEDSVKAEEIFSDEAQAAVDEWLGSKWSDVAQKYINGADLQECMRDSKIIIDSERVPNLYKDAFGGDAGGLEDLLNAELF
ncbi:MAG: hypothetical protein ACSW8K_10495 [bacterium]